MANPGSRRLNGKSLAKALRSDAWTVHSDGPRRLRVDQVQGLNVEPICLIAIDTSAHRIEVNAPYPIDIPIERADAVSAYMHEISTAINPVRWTLDRDKGKLVLTYLIEMALPASYSEQLLIEAETKRKVRMWVQTCIDRLDRYASGLNGILRGQSLIGVMDDLIRAEMEDAIYEANLGLDKGERV